MKSSLVSAGLSIAWIALVACAASAKDFVLVEDGRAAATIVTAAAPSENATAAARELQHYVGKITGAELPIADDSRPVSGSLVLVGPSRLTDSIPELKIPSGLTPQLREEGFVLWARPDRLVLAGNDEGPYLGTRYAVVELLHRLGVRWFMPGELGEVLPRTRTLTVSEMEVRQSPDFPMRNYWQHHRGTMAEEDTEWKIHHKMNPGMEDWFGVPGDSSVRAYMPPKDIFDAHPDWFALRRDGGRDPHMPCMTSAGMIGHFVERVKADARAGKRYSAFAPDDGMPRCYCEGCQKLANGFDGYGSNDRDPLVEASISNEWFHFVDAVLDAVNEEFPDHRIATNGYANRDIPPELPGFNERQNLVVMFANICACTLHVYDDPKCWQMRRQGQMVREWAKLCDKVWLYNYNYTMLVSKFTLTPMVSRVRRNIPLLKEWGVVGFHDQDEADLALTGLPTRIVRAALEWDTETDVDALLDDFYRRWYGRAAEPMRDYYDALETAFATTTAHGHEDVVLNTIYTPPLLEKLGAAIRQAEERARSEAEVSHVALERQLFDYLRDYVAMEAAKRECQFARAAMLAEGLTRRQAELNRISPFLGYEPYAVYGPDWEAKRMRELAAKTDGVQGHLVAVLPEEARARADPFDDGRFARWQDADLDESGWRALRTTRGWEDQGLSDAEGHAYRGVMWYRLTVDLPAEAAGKPLWLCAPAVVNEAWVWVNGRYAGHRPYTLPWFRPHAVELEITPLARPGEPNQITVRVLNNIDVFGASGIYERPFIYARATSSGSGQSRRPSSTEETTPKVVLRPATAVEFRGANSPDPEHPGESDCNNPAHWDGSTLYVFNSAGHPWRSSGPDVLGLSESYVRCEYDNQVNGGRWIECTWKAQDGALYGWYHNEPGGLCPGTHLTAPRIGAVRSADNGAHWQDLGIVLDAPPDTLDCSTANYYFAGGNGDFCIAVDPGRRFLYLFISTYTGTLAEQGVSVARMAYADLDQPAGKVWKWDGGEWTEPGLGGRVKAIFPARQDWHRPDVDAFWGPSIHFNHHLGQYVMLLNRAIDKNWRQEGVYVSFCRELAEPESWTEPRKILGDLRANQWYPSVIGLDRTRRETDKLAGRTARLFVRGTSEWEITFLRADEEE